MREDIHVIPKVPYKPVPMIIEVDRKDFSGTRLLEPTDTGFKEVENA